MERVMIELQHWLQKNNLPIDGVELHLAFPSGREAFYAESTFKAELKPGFVYEAMELHDGKNRLYGIPIKFTGPARP